MSDLIQRKAAVEAIKAIPPGNWAKVRYVREIEKVPSFDAVIVIPCEKCRFWFPYNRVKGDTWGVCSNTKSICNGRSVDKDWFCADGERTGDDV